MSSTVKEAERRIRFEFRYNSMAIFNLLFVGNSSNDYFRLTEHSAVSGQVKRTDLDHKG